MFSSYPSVEPDDMSAPSRTASEKDAPQIDVMPATSAFVSASPERRSTTGLLEVFGSSDPQNNIYAFGRSLSRRVQSLMSDSSDLTRWEREEASAHELSFHVAAALEKQHKLNQANLGLHGMNYAINMANTAASRKLKVALEAGERKTAALEIEVERAHSTIDVLNQSMSQLEAQNEAYQEKTERLKDALGNNTALLNKSLCELRANKATYDLAIENQMRIIRGLRSGRIKQDAIIDTILGLISAAIVNSTLFDAPIRLVLVLVPRARLRVWLRQFAKASTWIILLLELRKGAVTLGWHNRVGSAVPYAKELLSYSRRLVATSFAQPPPALLEKDANGECKVDT